MDFLIIFSAFLALFAYIAIQIIVFRNIDRARVIRAIISSLVLGMFSAGILIWIIFKIYLGQSQFFYFGWIVALGLFILLAVSYILGFFGMMAASLRVRILGEIYKSQERGMDHDEILKKYNKKLIVDERLLRLIGAGEVRKDGDKYILENRFSVFRMHHNLYVLFKKMYCN